MKYFELTFNITPNDEAAGDVLAALLADAGCETFVPSAEGLTAYIQQSAYDATAVTEATETLSALLPDHSATYTCAEAPDENWNAQWEAEHHFEPITLPDGQQIQIIPRQAFGSGEHATTRMILSLLASAPSSAQQQKAPSSPVPSSAQQQEAPSSPAPLAGQTVIDAGCGTGVLGIAAMKLGASRVFAYDIDEWSVRNAEENFALNNLPPASPSPSLLPPSSPLQPSPSSPSLQPSSSSSPLSSPSSPSVGCSAYSRVPSPSPLTILEGDARILSQAPPAHLLLANINRNILLADLPAFASKLLPGGRLLLSGFLAADIAPLVERATSLGLTLESTLADGDWRALAFTAPVNR